eukprot:TRINITY_DN14652_c0_g1_i3.p1 TRINITY_DN14652_c0_g1~~TRINITY_DN14652_c0_g1_i3.p1  ORF type:complete len:207 (+),score=32.70 TRINITY_DN14652_c0_g1_i3:195-815(+)
MCIRDRVSTQSTGISATSNMVWHVVKDSDEGTAHGLRYAVSYAQGDRNEMEDTHVMKPAVQPNGELLSYFAVFDGHGGKIVSDSCAKAMPELCNKHLKGEVTVDTIRKALRNGCFDMDHSLQPVRGRTMTCGSTGIMGYITNSHYVIANVGDSRCILVRRSVGECALHLLDCWFAGEDAAGGGTLRGPQAEQRRGDRADRERRRVR